MTRSLTALVAFFILNATFTSAVETPTIENLQEAVAKQPRNPAVLFELAQAQYRNQQFDAFFGLVQWVRANLWANLNSEQRDHWFSLELMAMARFCLWSDIQKAARYKVVNRGPLVQKSLEIIALKSAYQKYTSDPTVQKPSFLKEIELKQNQWQIQSADLQKLASPVHLRAHVESQCSSS
jgi:hypothetical protein